MVSRSLALVLLSPAATYGSYVSSPRLLRRSGSGGTSSLAFGAATGHATSPSGRSAIQLATMSGAIVVTDGTDSFYGSRGIFQALYDGGEVDKIVAFSSSVSDAQRSMGVGFGIGLLTKTGATQPGTLWPVAASFLSTAARISPSSLCLASSAAPGRGQVRGQARGQAIGSRHSSRSH